MKTDDPMPNLADVQQSLQQCAALTEKSHSSFYPSFRFLKPEKRQAMEVLYGFMRYSDDLVDANGASADEKYAMLDQWQNALDWMLESVGVPADSSTSPTPIPTLAELTEAFPDLSSGLGLLPALRYIVEKYNIPKPVFSEVLLGVRSDIQPAGFNEFEDCADYCHMVATSVGVASLAIWGTKEPLFSTPIVKAAKASGIAIQLTNIIRDLAEDMRAGRCYLPKIELQHAGLTERQLLDLIEYESGNDKQKAADRSPEEHFAANEFQSQLETFYGKYDKLMERELDRIETHFLVAGRLYDSIEKDARRSFGVIWDTYFRLYKKMRRNPRKIMSKNFRLGFYEKMMMYFRWKFFPPRHLN